MTTTTTEAKPLPVDFFAGVREAQVRNKYPDFPAPGKYLVRIDSVNAGITQPSEDSGKYPTEFFAIHYTVLKVMEESTFSCSDSHRVGDICQHFLRKRGFKGAPAKFQEGIKQFLVGTNPDFEDKSNSMSDEEYAAACFEAAGEAQPFKGMVAKLDNKASYSKKQMGADGEPIEGSTPFVNPYWNEALTADEVREQLDEATIQRFSLLD